MATIFVQGASGSNANNGTTWALAKQTVAGALAIAASNDVIVVNSAESFTATGAITWTPPAGNIAIISVTVVGASGFTWNAGAAESVGAANAGFAIGNASGSAMYIYGMTINGGTNNSASCVVGIFSTTGAVSTVEMDTCTIDMKSVSTSATFSVGMSASANRSHKLTARNCTFICSASRAGVFSTLGEATVELINPTFSMSGVTKPVTLFQVAGLGDAPYLTIRDGDISGFSTAASALFAVGNFTTGSILLKNLKLSATPALTSGTWPGGTSAITVRNCDSADTITTFQYVNTYGTLTQSTSIYLSAGIQFNSAGISWQIVTTSSAGEYTPFISPLIARWDTSTSSQTAELEFIRDSATALTDRQIWSDMDYAASASFPNYTYATNRNANPFTGTGADQPSSSAAWTGAGGFSNTTKQKLQIAFTAAEVGLLQSRVYVGKASETLYLNASITNVS